MNKKLLFVYGTLKKGFSRSSYLSTQKYLGIAKTTSDYAMFAYGGYPALVKLEKSSDSFIYGELYEVDHNCLEAVDHVEGVNTGLFERRTINLDSVNLTHLPSDPFVFESVQKKQAEAYFFLRSIDGAKNCGACWTNK